MSENQAAVKVLITNVVSSKIVQDCLRKPNEVSEDNSGIYNARKRKHIYHFIGSSVIAYRYLDTRCRLKTPLYV